MLIGRTQNRERHSLNYKTTRSFDFEGPRCTRRHCTQNKLSKGGDVPAHATLASLLLIPDWGTRPSPTKKVVTVHNSAASPCRHPGTSHLWSSPRQASFRPVCKRSAGTHLEGSRTTKAAPGLRDPLLTLRTRIPGRHTSTHGNWHQTSKRPHQASLLRRSESLDL